MEFKEQLDLSQKVQNDQKAMIEKLRADLTAAQSRSQATVTQIAALQEKVRELEAKKAAEHKQLEKTQKESDQLRNDLTKQKKVTQDQQ